MGMKKAGNCETVEEVYVCLKELDEDKRRLRSPEDVEAVELEILSYTNQLAALLLKKISDKSGLS
ncbi:hypothetical protein [Desulforhopalus vacuolatus]|uniref:hypothetical protein n=1 Tax=Desulforhopalus vacuolatus TaxID=40414 RepID=UPI001F055790|nr:hypothetical protein [Desulforhopalus vacuolatus]